MRADLQDLGIVIVCNFADSYVEGDDIAVVVAPAGTDIASVADLAGKRIGVNSIGSAGDVTTMRAVDEAGADSSTIEFIEVGMPDAQAQLEAGNIDAAILTDPFTAAIVAEGGSIVLSPYQAAIPGLSTQVVMTTSRLLDEDAEFVSEFTAALNEAITWAEENEDAVSAALADELGVPVEVAETLRHSDFSSEVSRDDLEALAQIAVDYGVFERLPDFDRLIQVQ
jgi:NitT/TauT family transport system substrate-binding protein